jgi:hypothetical protein
LKKIKACLNQKQPEFTGNDFFGKLFRRQLAESDMNAGKTGNSWKSRIGLGRTGHNNSNLPL